MKNINYLKVGLVMSTLFLTSNAFAACSATACSGKIERLYMPNADYIYIEMDQSTQALVDAYDIGTTGCKPVSRNLAKQFEGYFTLNSSHKRFDEVYSLLLASKFSDKDVTIRFSNQSANCTISYIVLQ
jgi:hypothetical protein